MSAILDLLERYFTESRDRILARSHRDYSKPVYLLGWRIVIPTKPEELYSAYFLWPSLLSFICLCFPVVFFANHPYPVHSRYEALAYAEHLAGNAVAATLYTVMDAIARAVPFGVVLFNGLVQTVLLYGLLSRHFWNRRARRLRKHPAQAASPSRNVWPPPPSIS